jgi:hypothetical protein
MFLLSSCNSSSRIRSGLKLASAQNDTFLIFEQFHTFLTSAQTVLSNQDFGVEQFFQNWYMFTVCLTTKQTLLQTQ